MSKRRKVEEEAEQLDAIFENIEPLEVNATQESSNQLTMEDNLEIDNNGEYQNLPSLEGIFELDQPNTNNDIEIINNNEDYTSFNDSIEEEEISINNEEESSSYSSEIVPRWTPITDLHPEWKPVTGIEFGFLLFASLVNYKNKLILFGGYDTDNYAFNPHTSYFEVGKNEWIEFSDSNAPSARDNHTALIYKNFMIVFGGNGISADYLSDTYFLDLDSMRWEKKKTYGPTPKGRSHHGAFIYDDKMYIHGGKYNNKILSNMAYLDLKTFTWSKQYEFFPRLSHYNFVYNGFLYAYGGFKTQSPNSNESEVPLCFINLKTYEKGVLALSSNKSPKIERVAEYVDQTRLPLNFANAAALCYDKLLVVLPPSKPNGYLIGIWSLNLNTLTWKQHLDKQAGILLNTKPGTNNLCFNDTIINNNSNSNLVYKNYFALAQDNQKFFLLGAGEQRQNYACSILEIDITEYGLIKDYIPNNNNNFKEMFDNPNMSDFKIYSKDATKPPIFTHKFLLYTRWHHFNQMQKSGMGESNKDHLVIPESYDTVYGFLKYIYTDSLTDLSTLTIANLLALGNLYNLSNLQALCCIHLHQNITVDNVAHIYFQATKSNELGLKKRTIKFMFENFGKVVKSKGYQKLPRQALIDFWFNLPADANLIA